MTTPQPVRARRRSLTERLLAVLEQTYPAYDSRRRASGMWSAVRVTPPSLAQVEAGLHRYIVQPSGEALAAVLARQLEISQRVRG